MDALENNYRRSSFLSVVRSGLPTLLVSIVIAALTSVHGFANDQETKTIACRNAAGYHVSGFGVEYDDLDADRAIALCRAAISETPNDVSLFPYLARALQKKGDEPSISEALKLAQLAAESHDAEGMTCLANLLESGVGVQKDLRGALSLYSEASEKHFAPAQFNLSHFYADGIGVDKNQARSLELLAAAAAADYAPALERLAALNADNKVPNASPVKARELMGRAASQNYGPALFELAYFLGTGVGGPRDLDRALAIYQDLVRRSTPNAKKSADWIAQITKNNDQLSYLKRESESGSYRSILNLAMFYCDAPSTHSDDQLCVENLKRAARLEQASGKPPASALVRLSSLYENGRGTALQRSEQKSLEVLLIAANIGDGKSAIKVGEAYASGKGVPKSEEEARRWFTRAGESDEAQAVVDAADKFTSGDEVARNSDLAIKFYSRAGDLGSTDALMRLARELAGGERLPKNLDRAGSIYEQLSAAGNKEASSSLAYDFSIGEGGFPKDETKATMYYHRAAEQGDKYAMNKLARRLVDGTGTQKSVSEAADWLAKSLENGYRV